MQPVGRKRKSTNSGLEPRVYIKHAAFYYVHRTGKWERLGVDLEESNQRARLYNDPDGQFGTMVYWLDMFLVDCQHRVDTGSLAQRTLEDYTSAIKGTDKKPGALRQFFAPPMTPLDVEPSNVQAFLDVNAELGRPVPANREKAALSSCMSWLIRTGKVQGLVVNPCLRASGIKRNAETKRDRYVSHEDYQDIWAVAHPSVRMMMELTYRTLQRPESDIIGWTTDILLTEGGQRKLQFKQGKTGKRMKIAIAPALDKMIRDNLGDVPKLHQPLIRTRDGSAYTYDGLSAMLRRAFKKANTDRSKRGLPLIQSFGFRDLKGKGATDMWQEGTPIEQIQHLCGHEDKSTTEIYVKQRWQETAIANAVAMSNIQ
jgi:integrase